MSTTKMTVTATLAAVICLVIVAPCFGSTAQIDGNELLEKCKVFFNDAESRTTVTSKEQIDTGFCAGYLAGVLDVEAMWSASDKGKGKVAHYCLPKDGVPNGQVFKIVKKWLDAHPEKLHWRADSIIHIALLEAFPCTP